ncbi:DMT family transporter [Celeribacter sp.]|uniref:DMT family transporter n=1 Tax=Celeribacter sp. TaxID=1890673 RepID=UPI003A95C0FD
MTSASENTRGAVLMAASMAAFVFNDSFMKALLDDIPLNQALFYRGVVSIVMVFIVVTRFVGPLRFRMSRRDWSLTTVRSIAEVGAAFTFLRAIASMPLANASAIMQTMPLSITIASVLIFRDPLGWRRMLAIVIGFLGVLLIVKPGTDGFDSAALWALCAVVFVTIRDLSVRAMSHDASTSTVTMSAVALVTIVSGVALIGQPLAPMSALNWAQLMGTGSFVVLGYVLSVIVMKVGDVSFVSPFRYTALVWALLVGFLVFGEWPDALALLGAATIAATGIYTVIREQRLARRAAAAARDAS